MRFLVLIKADAATEAGVLPDETMIAAMTRYNEKLANAGVLLAAEGLYPSARGARVTYSDDKPRVTGGPFTEANGLIAGYWLWQCASLDEAIAWVERGPFGGPVEIEIRELFKAAGFGATLSPELRQRSARVTAKMTMNAERKAA